MDKNEKLADRLELAAKIIREGLRFEYRHQDHFDGEWTSYPNIITWVKEYDFHRWEIRIKPEPVMVPLEAADIKPGSVVRIDPNGWEMITNVGVDGFTSDGMGPMAFKDAMEHETLEILIPGFEWTPCQKEGGQA